MFAQSYENIIAESTDNAKQKEREAFDHAIELLVKSQDPAASSMDLIDALRFLEQLWTILMEDLAEPDNSLSQEVKAQLISIGIWMMKEIVALRLGQSSDLNTLIEVNQIIRNGLD